MSAHIKTGTITELSPQDGLGWITTDDGERIRFGGNACRFMPQVGLRVRVLGTEPAYSGGLKATAVELAPGQAAPAVVQSAAPPGDVSKLLALGIPVDDALQRIVRHADENPGFRSDLEWLRFELNPMQATELDCHATDFFVVALNGGGSAFGLDATGTTWKFWDHEDDSIVVVCKGTPSFFAGLLWQRGQFMKKREPLERARATLTSVLGIALPDDVPRDFPGA